MDKGHLDLIEDLENLLKDAKNFMFHDFKNEEFATPKMEFSHRLQILEQNMMQGKYDNEATPEEQKELMDKLKGE